MSPSSFNKRSHIPRVGVIGGGPGGLLTLFWLQRFLQVPAEFHVWEATERLGGKVLSRKFDTVPQVYEAGAAEFYDYSPIGRDPLKEHLQSLGLPLCPLQGNSVILNEHHVANLDDLESHFGCRTRQSVEAFTEVAEGLMSRQEFYEAGTDEAVPWPFPQETFASWLQRGLTVEGRRFIETWIHSDLATETSATNVNYGLQNYLMNHPRYLRLFKIAGGNEQWIERLNQQVTAERHFGYSVASIAPVESGVWRITATHSELPVGEVDYLIVALPLNALQNLKCSDSYGQQRLMQHCHHFNHPAHYLRITMLLVPEGIPPASRDGFIMLEAGDGCCLYFESQFSGDGGNTVWGWLLGGAAAESLMNQSDEELRAWALQSLPPTLAIRPEQVQECHIHRWLNAVNAMPGGWQSLSLSERHRPLGETNPGLWVVGDYLFDSTLNGVFDSARYVAESLACELNQLRN